MFQIALKNHHFKPHFQKIFWGGQGPPNPLQMAEVYLLENDGRGKKLKGKKKRGKGKGEEKKGKRERGRENGAKRKKIRGGENVKRRKWIKGMD